jgi:hypothetical protein
MTDKQSASTYTPTVLLKVLAGLTAGLVLLFLLLNLFYPMPQLWLALTAGDPTQTPTPTVTEVFHTATPRPTATPTLTTTPTITNTPFPLSRYQVDNATDIRPESPIQSDSVHIINDSDADVTPAFDNFQWISSDQIGSDIGREFAEPYHATFGAGSIRWSMDQPLPPALYEVYILDTLYSSGGSLEFSVELDGTAMPPVTGSTLLRYYTTQDTFPQLQDEWRSIGIYDLQTPGILSVSTSWEERDELSIVAVDRVMIIKLDEQVRLMLSQLPIEGDIYLMDDASAEVTSGQYWNFWDNDECWGQECQVIDSPPVDATATFRYHQSIPNGEYEIYAWIPRLNGSIPVSYSLFASGVLMENDAGESEVELTDGQGQYMNAQWLYLGTWSIPERFGSTVIVNVVVTIPTDEDGEAVIDAIALVRK